MKGEKGKVGLSASELELLSRWNISKWCNTDDPVSREAIRKARTLHFRMSSNEELAQAADTMDTQLPEGWEKIKYGSDYYRGEVGGEDVF